MTYHLTPEQEQHLAGIIDQELIDTGAERPLLDGRLVIQAAGDYGWFIERGEHNEPRWVEIPHPDGFTLEVEVTWAMCRPSHYMTPEKDPPPDRVEYIATRARKKISQNI